MELSIGTFEPFGFQLANINDPVNDDEEVPHIYSWQIQSGPACGCAQRRYWSGHLRVTNVDGDLHIVFVCVCVQLGFWGFDGLSPDSFEHFFPGGSETSMIWVKEQKMLEHIIVLQMILQEGKSHHPSMPVWHMPERHEVSAT